MEYREPSEAIELEISRAKRRLDQLRINSVEIKKEQEMLTEQIDILVGIKEIIETKIP